MTVCDDGLLRDEDGFIGVALSNRHGTVGDRFILYLSSGIELKVVMCDIKSSKHLANNCTDSSGAMVEFVVDTNLIANDVRMAGSFDIIFEGKIERIEREK